VPTDPGENGLVGRALGGEKREPPEEWVEWEGGEGAEEDDDDA